MHFKISFLADNPLQVSGPGTVCCFTVKAEKWICWLHIIILKQLSYKPQSQAKSIQMISKVISNFYQFKLYCSPVKPYLFFPQICQRNCYFTFSYQTETPSPPLLCWLLVYIKPRARELHIWLSLSISIHTFAVCFVFCRGNTKIWAAQYVWPLKKQGLYA